MAAVVPALLNNLVLQLRGTEQGRSDETKFFTTHIHIISRSFSDSQYPENTTHANFQLNNLVLWSVVFFLSGYKPVLLVNLPGEKNNIAFQLTPNVIPYLQVHEMGFESPCLEYLMRDEANVHVRHQLQQVCKLL